MYEAKNPLSATSYTNKDFQSIYEELLETAKNLAKNWDPTISNESDPGVVLLKLNAIIGDKNNYNIDKNVLENYPETYTQEFSARSQYRQLGYKMPWYRAATTDIALRWVGKKLSEGTKLTIDKYTMVTDSGEDIVYTLLEDVTLGIATGADLEVTVPAIQGIINTLTIAGSDIVTLSNLDSRNRLYIRDRYIAENGIYVFSNSNTNAGAWLQVDNVEVQESNVKCYEFDVDPMSGHPFLQFPDDIRDLIGSGLVIKYIVTNGVSGNVSAKTINKFYNTTTVTLSGPEGSESISLSDANVQLFNENGTVNGADPETIEDAYKSFRRTVATFDTLVTLRDYLNAIYTSEYVSNAIVTDRTNDIQSTYRIIDKDKSSILGYVDYLADDNSKVSYTKVDEEYFISHPDNKYYIYDDDNGVFSPLVGTYSIDGTYTLDTSNKYMDAFSLKYYLLKNCKLVNSVADYNDTFDIDNSNSTYTKIKAHLDSKKSIQHDRKDIQPSIPFMLQNVYPIKLKIVPTHKLSDEQQAEVKANILSSLVKLLNSRNCEFGEEPNYDLIYNEIATSDERIKVVIMDDFVYTTYAVYMDKPTSSSEPEFKFIPVSDYSTCESIIVRDKSAIPPVIVNTGSEEGIKKHIKKKLVEAVNLLKGNGNSGKASIEEIKNWLLVDSTYGIAYKVDKSIKEIGELTDGDLVIYSDKLLEIRKEIIARNILAGVTPLFDPDDSFNLSLNMKIDNNMSQNTNFISTGLTISPFGIGALYNPSVRSATYKLKDNESIRFYAPSFITDRTYSNYVRFELVLARPTIDTTKYNIADPDNEAELRAIYGDDSFYTLMTSGAVSKYEKVTTARYENLTRKAPQFKYGHYFVKNHDGGSEYVYAQGSGGLVELKGLSNIIDYAVTTRRKIEFEPGLFYRKTTSNNSNYFECVTEIPDNWDSYYDEDYYIRIPKYNKYIPVIDTCTVDDLDGSDFSPNKDNTGTYKKIQITYTKASKPDSFTPGYYIENSHTEGEGESAVVRKWYTEILTEDVFKTTPESVIYKRTVTDVMENGKLVIKLGKEISDWKTNWKSYAVYTDICGLNTHDQHCFEKLGGYMTGVTIQGDDGSLRTLMIGSTETKEELETRLSNNYSTATFYRTSDPAAWETEYHEYYIRSLTADGIEMFAAESVVPSFIGSEIYRQNISDDDSISYSKVGLRPEAWEDTFHNYYVLVSEREVGLHPNSPETADWRAGRLTVYVPSVSYTIPANTEYQLKDGDCISFFYRESNDDDAPYTFYKYTHMYDESADLPTIIKSNFTIHASNYSNCKINPASLSSSGTIDTANPKFAVIHDELLNEHDLSGTKQIELRAINRVKVDASKNKFYYIITSEPITNENGEDFFSMKLKRSETKTGKVRYTRTLQNDEYFIYTNKDKTLFEILSSGTMIEYFPGKVPGYVDDGDGFITISNPSIDVNRIMYSGIDAFADQCLTVASGDTFNLIEQQIYALTTDDSIHIQLDESFGYNHRQVHSDETFNTSNKVKYFTKDSEYVLVQGHRDLAGNNVFPPYIPDTYYTYKDGVYTVVTGGVPKGWGTDSTTDYYTSTGATYTELSGLTEKKFEEYRNAGILYISDVPTYPSYSSKHESSVSDYTVSYCAGTSAYTALPSIKVNNGDYGWNAVASLNIKIDKGSYQKIDPKDDYSERTVTIKGYSYPSEGEKDPIFIMSDIPLDKLGGEKVDISYVKLSGDLVGANLLVYKELFGEDSVGDWMPLTDGAIGLTIPANTDNKTYDLSNISLDSDFKYILPIESYSDELKFRVWVKTRGTPSWKKLACMCHETIYSESDEVHYGISSKDKHFYMLPSDTTDIRIGIPHGYPSSSDSVIRLNTLFKYQERDIFTDNTSSGTGLKYGISTDELVKKLCEMDKPRKFDYTYNPPSEVRVGDPLAPQSLYDANHVYNKFTISKAILNEYKLGGSSTIFVNNR